MWSDLGAPEGYNLRGTAAPSVVVQTNLNGTQEVFVVGNDQALWHIGQLTTGQNAWTGWTSLGKPSADPAHQLSTQCPLAVGRNADGSLEAFAMDIYGGLWHIWQNGSGGQWIPGWTFLEPPPAVGYTAYALSAASNFDSSLQLFMVGTQVWNMWQLTSNLRFNPPLWSDWSALGVPPNSSNPGNEISSPAVVLNSADELQVFVTYYDNAYANGSQVWYLAQEGPRGPWGSWQPLFSPQIAAGRFSRPAVGKNTDGSLVVFVGAFDGTIWYLPQLPGTSDWQPDWQSLGPPVGGTQGYLTSPSVATNWGGRPELFVIGTDGGLWHNWQTAAGWNGWQSLGQPPGGGPLTDLSDVSGSGVNEDGTTEVFAVASTAGIWHLPVLAETPGGVGVCPAGGPHDASQSSDYTLVMDTPSAPGQHDWRWCGKCSALNWGSGTGPGGTCAAGGQHERQSSDYALVMDTPSAPGQSDWRWCGKCSVLNWGSGTGPGGICAAGGQHDRQSSDYTLVMDTPSAPGQSDWRWCIRCSTLVWAG
jgi:hypothetical protein